MEETQVGQTGDTPQAPVDNSTGHAQEPTSQVNTSDVSNSTQTPPPQNAAPETNSGIDYQKRYDDLRKRFDRTTNDFSLTRKEMDKLKKQYADMAKTVSQFRGAQDSPEKLIQELQTEGPKALERRIQAVLEEREKQFQEERGSSDEKLASLEQKYELMARQTSYPNFKELQPVMQEIWESENCPIDAGLPVGEILDGLYYLAKERNSQDAIKNAAESARKRAEAGLAKEAGNAVASGGKTGVISVDPKKMSAQQLRNMFIEKGMVSD